MAKLSTVVKDFFRTRRYYVYGLATIIALGLPFITIGGNHIFLLSFDKMQLQLVGMAFDMQEFYLMPFLLMLMFFGIFFTTALGGRVWCGWACPQTVFRVIYRDLIETKLLGLRRRIENKQAEPDMSKGENKRKKVLAVLLWSLLALVAGADFVWFFVPPEDFFRYLADPAEHTVMITTVLIVAGFLIYDVIWMQENFCFYVCPYVRIQSVLYDNDTIMPIYDAKGRGGVVYDDNHNQVSANPAKEGTGECIGCNKCVTVCPTHIDIRKGLQMECINCLECVDACTEIMGNLGKETLVHWSSPNEIENHEKTKWIRTRTIMYGILLTIVTVALFMMGAKKEHMLLNINRTSELYKVDNAGVVSNDYTFLFQNTDHNAHTYYFEVDNPDIAIERPTEPFKLDAGAKSKKVVVLVAKKPLANDARKDTPMPIKIKAYAKDDATKIVVFRDTVFVYPKLEVINAKKAN